MQIKSNYPLKNITTLQIGGLAKKFVSINSVDELKEAVQYANTNNLNHLVIGGGSNLLVSDDGVDMLIIKNEIGGIASQGLTLQVKSGTILQDLVNYSISHGLSGLQKLTGIPGTLGGAVYGNAGAYGQTISDHITEVVFYDGQHIATLSKDQCGFNYRDSGFKRNHNIILEVTFQLEKADSDILAKETAEILSKRLVKYPKGIKCPGSFFKNIVTDTLPQEILQKIPKEAVVYGKLPAGYLLESVGAKGQQLDGIEIAPYHANLFVNKGSGSATAFYDLAKKYADLVKQKFGILLEPEVQLINLPKI
ncbi:UDP-N-acetylenolpyruvoylglucosamine reductase [Candidatus Daviesbacteria bacterium RIFCSPLOWO2_01_FULL_39_12]|uniref:UDP-N-acetylenolpyruvoylglucosamine reductase n=1 Tax=Candidatus Daviesbacteria bacterium RIFCSPLOWO2_01_FULL_39_12 TaxID=1797785 RepID=A0A1F5KSH8_9BACT|nr:MAG: UDP-N-acetylenolpyruvoylglucosamine reductase [Candidatus Daviesbacteria bacterium RIFCSPHIGHO2_02_FULL_39_8]OGE43878.1 MAG: UDP-N-acetylenolpyruvoylglucosamine reductase [Candidatus Daviesbacteria bacterium RIFCSPLOWO2_01_FULL_39_12]